MHVAGRFLIGNRLAAPVAAEDRVGRKGEIGRGIVAPRGNHGLAVPAGKKARKGEGERSLALGIAAEFGGIVLHGGDGCLSVYFGALRAPGFAECEGGAHALKVMEGAPERGDRKLQRKVIAGFQYLGRGGIEPRAERAYGRLPEVAALGVLLVGAPRNQGDFDIRERCAEQDARYLLFLECAEYLLLVLDGELFRRERTLCLQTAARRKRFQQEMHFRIVAERFKVSGALGGFRDGLAVADARRLELDRERKAAQKEFFQDFHLHLAHQGCLQFTRSAVKAEAETRLFFFERTKARQPLAPLRARR